MTTAEARQARVSGRTRELWMAARPAVVPVCLLAFGYAPLLVLRARALLDRPHLAAFPIAVIAGMVLAWKSSRRLGRLEPGVRSWPVAAVGLGMGALVLAGFSAWVWPGAAAAMTTLLAGAYGIGGARLVRAVLPAWAFVALAVLAPVGAELWLIDRMQTLVTACGCPVLDALRVIHLTEGNVIKIASRPLMVEQACSGVSSLFAAIGVTLFYVLWTRRKLFPAVVLVSAAAFWMVVGNVVRVVAVVFAEARWGVDMASGWRHEVWGLAIFAAVLALTLSTDQLLQFLASLTTIRLSRPEVWELSDLDFPSDANRPPPTPHPVVERLTPTEFADVGRTWLSSRRIGSVFAVLGLMQVVWLWPLLAEAVWGYLDARPLHSLVVTLQTLSEGDLPDHLGPYLRKGFETKVRGTESSFGEFSRDWHYRSDQVPATAAVDFPFRGWHELTQCYKNIGWTLKQRVVRTGEGPDAGESGARVEAVFERPPGRRAALIFGIDDLRGDDLKPPLTRDSSVFGDRLDIFRFARSRLGALVGSGDQSMTDGYQVQLLIQTAAPLSVDQWIEARAVFARVRQDVRRRVASGIGGGSKGGPS